MPDHARSPRLCRRRLLITGTIGLCLALAVLAVYFGIGSLQHSAPWLALIALVIYIASSAVGLGLVLWLMISEIFPLQLRGRMMSATALVNWLSNFAVAATFLTLVSAITRTGTFLLYTAIATLAVAFFAARVPETRGRSLEEIQTQLTGRNDPRG